MDLSQVQVYLPKDNVQLAAIAAFGFGTVYLLSLAIYRLFISPLAKFPGPKLAALTSWYELYYDVVKQGQYLWEIEKMHDKYGPIVRINPFELSIKDSNYYDEVYVVGSVRQTDRYEAFTEGLVDFDGAHLATVGHELHRKRRAPLDPYFSKAGISKLEPMVWDLTDKLMQRFESFKGTGHIVRLDHALTAFSGDVINRLCIDDPPNLIDDADFSPWWFDIFHGIAVMLPTFMCVPWFTRLLRHIPQSVLAILDPKAQKFNELKLLCDDHIKVAKREAASGESKNSFKIGSRPTVFRHIVNCNLPVSELSDDRLSKEAQVMIGAGTMTTAGTMNFLTYYVMSDPAIRDRLQDELAPVMADYPEKKPTWAELEALPYFQAIIKESLRLSYGTMHRRPRVSPKVPLQYREWVIPAGVPVGMSAYFAHRDPVNFPDPDKFLPERWMDNVTPGMRQNFVPFSKGSRHCLGMHLAYCEINFVIAALFRPGGLNFQMFNTTEADVKPVHDMIVPLPKIGTKGVRVTFN
ncbi:fusicoccadiene C-8 hydroxylase [Trichoderma asperellum]|uniref:Fusicoccadiene C-8 hydroxylase n=1 Tax=Trichoderma asperellum TaxID=101201 RepID=A0A6V8QQU1_TRIAP|nr:cytochrome P450 [Trichoderma asperelloides]GFP52833.1 fusicoccadiene C-8 hydroxylase [Trichoderma asperellum]